MASNAGAGCVLFIVVAVALYFLFPLICILIALLWKFLLLPLIVVIFILFIAMGGKK